MAVGIQNTKADVNNVAGGVVRQVFAAFGQVDQVTDWLLITTDEDLAAIGFQPGEVAVLRSTFSDLGDLALVFRGGVSARGQYDYRTFSKRLKGILH